MSITKYANIESILEVKSSVDRLPYDENGYFPRFASLQAESSDDGYLYVRCRAISSRVNKNNDGWPSAELAKSYKSFTGRPIFVDHNNDDPSRARGVIVDSRLHQETDEDKVSSFDPYYATAPDNHKPPTWVELLLEVDAKTYPKLAKSVRNGDIDAVSMGANIESSICSVCAHTAKSPVEYCKHISSKGAEFEVTSANGEKIMKKSYEDCHDINFFEISFVFDPADPTALISDKSDNKLSKVAADEEHARDEQGNKECAICGAYATSEGEKVHKEQFGHDFKSKTAAWGDKGHGEVCMMCGNHGVSLGENCSTCNKSQTIRTISPTRPVNSKTADNNWGQTQTMDTQKERELNYIPQGDMPTRPMNVDTDRPDPQCPWCHSDSLTTDATGAMKCPSCSWVQPPHPLDNPDLTPRKDEQQSPELEQNHQVDPQVTFFSPQSRTLINEMEWQIISDKVVVDVTAAIAPKKKVLNPSLVTKTDDPQNAKVLSDQQAPVTSANEKVEDMDNDTEKSEAKLLTAFSLADELVALGAVEDSEKLALVAKLEDKTSEAQEAVRETINLFKEAGFSKPVATKTAGFSRVPKLAGFKQEASDDIPLEALFL